MKEKCPRCGDLQYLCSAAGVYGAAEVCSCAQACALCHGQGFTIEVNENGYRYAHRCRCQALVDRVRLFNLAEVPARYHACTVENFHAETDNQKEIRYYFLDLRKRFQSGDRGVLLMGNPGVGKTHLFVALVSHLTIERGLRCRFIEFMDLLSRLRDGFNQHRSASDLIEPLVEVPILFIDELGKGRGTDWELSVLDELISKRYNSERSTFFATNYRTEATPLVRRPDTERTWGTPLAAPVVGETLEDRVGPRIFSRLAEMCERKTLVAPDYRRRGINGQTPPDSSVR